MERQKVDIGEHSQSFPLRCTDRRCPRVPEPRVPLRRLDWKPLEGTPRLGSRYGAIVTATGEMLEPSRSDHRCATPAFGVAAVAGRRYRERSLGGC
jgi:hypothetical protein